MNVQAAYRSADMRDRLFGRDREIGRIRKVIEGWERRGGALLLLGEPGVGKTALLDAAAQMALATGVRVVRAAGVQFEADLPFAGLHQLLLPLCLAAARARGDRPG
jgi:MoxR-like ATPase